MKLKEFRILNNKKQQEVADYLNVKQNTYSQIESGKRKLSIEYLIKLSKFYDVSIEELLDID